MFFSLMRLSKKYEMQKKIVFLCLLQQWKRKGGKSLPIWMVNKFETTDGDSHYLNCTKGCIVLLISKHFSYLGKTKLSLYYNIYSFQCVKFSCCYGLKSSCTSERNERKRERVRKIDICEAGFKLALKDFARDRGEGFSRQQKNT